MSLLPKFWDFVPTLETLFQELRNPSDFPKLLLKKNGDEMKKSKATDPNLKKLIEVLNDKEEKIWKDIAKRLSKSRKNRAKINISKINRYAKSGETILVPGKVLGYGELDKKIIVSAFSLSKEAERKIKDSECEYLTIEQLVKKNPKGSSVRVFC